VGMPGADTGNTFSTLSVGNTGGKGGVGVLGTGGATVVNAGSISGGLSSDGSTRADAVHFTNGGNKLTLEKGYRFKGNVVSTSGTTGGGDTLGLGGDSTPTQSFDVTYVVGKLPANPAPNTT